MGFDARITRMEIGTGEDSNPITLEEWIYVAQRDNELQMIQTKNAINPITKTMMKIECKGFFIWQHTEKQSEVELYYLKGSIGVYSYDTCVINKLKQLAIQLEAKVVGEFDDLL